MKYDKIPELDPSEYTYDRYESDYMARLDVEYDYRDRTGASDRRLDAKIREHIVGWCDARKLYVRPRTDMIAVMFEDDDFEKFWCHISLLKFEKIFV